MVERASVGSSCLARRDFLAGLWRSVEPGERGMGHPRRRRGRRGHGLCTRVFGSHFLGGRRVKKLDGGSGRH